MKEKLSKLAKGIYEFDSPKITLVPEKLEKTLRAGSASSFAVACQCEGAGTKGICFSDDMRVYAEPETFTGRNTYITVHINTSGLSCGNRIAGSLTFLTEQGEMALPYRFEIEENPEGSAEEKTLSIEENPISYAAPCIKSEKTKKKDISFPDDNDALTGIISGLIDAKDTSERAYLFLREGVRRGLSITNLYESLIAAYPDDCSEALPKEVVYYFYFDRDIPEETAEKLYSSILRFEDATSDIFLSFAPRMSAFCMKNVLACRMSERLALIYDRMLCMEMIDYQVAEKLPDILKCALVTVEKGEADYMLISYPEYKTRVRAEFRGGRAFVPIYFEGARGEVFKRGDTPDEGDTLLESGVKLTKKMLFDKKDLLVRAFELCPTHRMLMLSACRAISEAQVTSEKDREILIEGLAVPEFEESLRTRMIGALAESEGDMSWLRLMKEDDYNEETLRSLAVAFMKAGDALSAASITKKYGIEFGGREFAAHLFEAMLEKHPEKIEGDPQFVRMAIYLFRTGTVPDGVIDFLARFYQGPAAMMLSLLRTALERNTALYELPENLLSFLLFSGEKVGLDETAEIYFAGENIDETLQRAYFTVRCADTFLYEEEAAGDFLFEALSKYMAASSDPAGLPTIWLIAMTDHFSKQKSLTEDEAFLCQLTENRLIDEGYVFRYTKRLRNLINIPDEIAWKYYIEYKAPQGAESEPSLLVKILPDDNDFHVEKMRRVYARVYEYEAVLFPGDSLHYHIYASSELADAVEEGTVNVAKETKGTNRRMMYINRISKAMGAGDLKGLREDMLSYAAASEVTNILFGGKNG